MEKVCGTQNGLLKLIDLESGKEVATTKRNNNYVSDVCVKVILLISHINLKALDEFAKKLINESETDPTSGPGHLSVLGRPYLGNRLADKKEWLSVFSISVSMEFIFHFLKLYLESL